MRSQNCARLYGGVTCLLYTSIKKLEVTADAGQDLMYYGTDYFLGDVLPFKLTRYGLRLAARLTGVRTIYEASGRSVVLQLSLIHISSRLPPSMKGMCQQMTMCLLSAFPARRPVRATISSHRRASRSIPAR